MSTIELMTLQGERVRLHAYDICSFMDDTNNCMLVNCSSRSWNIKGSFDELIEKLGERGSRFLVFPSQMGGRVAVLPGEICAIVEHPQCLGLVSNRERGSYLVLGDYEEACTKLRFDDPVVVSPQ